MIRKLRTFAGKVRRRGARYAWAAGKFYASSAAYRVKAVLRPERGKGGGGENSSSRFHFSAEELPGIIAAAPEELKARTIAEAEAAAVGRFDFRGLGEREFRGRVDWTPAGMHRSWRWDLNRHGFFVALGKAHYYSGEVRFLRKLAELWEDWIRMNPAGRGANWEQPFEVAARLQNWMWAYFLLAESGWAGTERLARLRGAMREHAEFVAAHLEWHWPNNHLLLEAKALGEWAVLFPEMDRGGKWLKRGLRVVEEQVAAQVLGDGVHCELCPMYHRIVAGELAEFVEICRRNGVGLRRPTHERIAKMTAFGAAMLRKDGTTPLFGDSAVEDGYLRFDAARREYSDMNWWLWRGGRPGRQARRVEEDAVTLETFEAAGYAVVRDKQRGVHLAFDAGAFSRCAASDHAHCDALSFELYAGGRPLIVDPGVYFAAGEGAKWRKYFRSTAAHNTVGIDGREQSELWGLSDVKRTARVQMTKHGCAMGAAWVAGECRPYWGGGEGIVHRREMQYADGRVEILDRVEGSGRHQVAWHFHFAPGVRVKLNENGEIVGRDESGEELFRMKARAGMAEWKLVEGKEGEAGMGWVSRNSVKLEKAWGAVMEMEGELPMEEEFEIELVKRADAQFAEAQVEESAVR